MAELQRAKDSLREEKAFGDAVMGSLPGVFYVLDAQARFVRWNQHMESVTGLPAEQLDGLDALATLHADDRPEAASALESTLLTGANETRELRMLGPDGPRCFILTANRLEMGGATFVVGSGVDIGDRRRLETALQEREVSLRAQHATLRALADAASGPVFSVDADYRYTSFNAKHEATMAAIYGSRIEQGASILDCMTVAADRTIAKANLDRALAGESFTEEAYSGDDARARVYFSVSHAPIRDAGDKIAGAAVFATDISERRRAEQELLEKNQTLEQFFSVTLDLLCIADTEGRFLKLERAWEQTLGFTQDELTAGRFFDFIHPEDVEPDLRGGRGAVGPEPGRRLRQPLSPQGRDVPVAGVAFGSRRRPDLRRGPRHHGVQTPRRGASRQREALPRTGRDLPRSDLRHRRGRPRGVREHPRGADDRPSAGRGDRVVARGSVRPRDVPAHGREPLQEGLRIRRAGEFVSDLDGPRGRVSIATWLVPIVDDDGEVDAVFGVSRDVTELKRRGGARASEDKSKHVRERSPIGKSLTRPWARSRSTTPSSRCWGTRATSRRGDVAGASRTPTMSPRRKRWSTRCSRVRRDEAFRQTRPRQGRLGRLGRRQHVPRRDAAGAPEFFTTSAVDITDRRAAEERSTGTRRS